MLAAALVCWWLRLAVKFKFMGRQFSVATVAIMVRQYWPRLLSNLNFSYTLCTPHVCVCVCVCVCVFGVCLCVCVRVECCVLLLCNDLLLLESALHRLFSWTIHYIYIYIYIYLSYREYTYIYRFIIKFIFFYNKIYCNLWIISSYRQFIYTFKQLDFGRAKPLEQLNWGPQRPHLKVAATIHFVTR